MSEQFRILTCALFTVSAVGVLYYLSSNKSPIQFMKNVLVLAVMAGAMLLLFALMIAACRI